MMESLLLLMLFVMQGSVVGDLPVLAVSEAYNTISTASRHPYRTYAIHAGLGLVLDASSYRFTSADAESVNRVHVARGKAIYRGGELQIEGITAVYGRAWTVDSGPCVLSPSTLKPMLGSSAFAPLRPGEVLAVGIGHFSPPGTIGEDFVALWAARVEVK